MDHGVGVAMDNTLVSDGLDLRQKSITCPRGNEERIRKISIHVFGRLRSSRINKIILCCIVDHRAALSVRIQRETAIQSVKHQLRFLIHHRVLAFALLLDLGPFVDVVGKYSRTRCPTPIKRRDLIIHLDLIEFVEAPQIHVGQCHVMEMCAALDRLGRFDTFHVRVQVISEHEIRDFTLANGQLHATFYDIKCFVILRRAECDKRCSIWQRVIHHDRGIHGVHILVCDDPAILSAMLRDVDSTAVSLTEHRVQFQRQARKMIRPEVLAVFLADHPLRIHPAVTGRCALDEAVAVHLLHGDGDDPSVHPHVLPIFRAIQVDGV